MLFSDRSRTHYHRAPVHEVICQLRFPTILSINNEEPAEFQEIIREEFPQYVRRQQAQPPKIIGAGTPNARVEQLPSITNYTFLSEDNRWKVSLTRDFIALSTVCYRNWEEFVHYLDKPLAAFIKHYHPAFFQRVGLRYVNIISRKKLGVENTPWTQLISPAYAGPLQEPDAVEDNFAGYICDFTTKLDSSCQVKIHAGLNKIKSTVPGAAVDPEMKFIFDMDLSMNGNTPCTLSAAALETLHGHATRIFEGAVTDTLRDAMEPS